MPFILILLLIVGTPVAILRLIRQHHLKRGRDAMQMLSQEIRDLLKAPEYRRFAEYHEKRAYRIRAIVQGAGLYLFILLVGIIRSLIKSTDPASFAAGSLVLLPFILFFVLRDILRAGNRTQVWCIPACMCPEMRAQKSEEMVCFYDFLCDEYRAAFVHMPIFSRKYAPDELFEVFAVERGNQLLVYHVVKQPQNCHKSHVF